MRWTRVRALLVILLAAATASVFSTTIAYQTVRADGRQPDEFSLAVLNSSFWFGWALLAWPLTALAARWRIDRAPRVAVPLNVIAALIAGTLHICLQTSVQAGLYLRMMADTAGTTGMLDLYWNRWQALLPGQLLQLTDWELLAGMGVIALAHAVYYRREVRDREIREVQLETRLVESQLSALRQQVNPHFLFNTLHAVSALMHRDVEAANNVLVGLSDLLRMSLDSGNRKEWLLSDELEFLDKYLSIERIRLGDRLHVDFEVDPDTFQARVPTLILQPLVENAIKHGVAPHGGRGVVEIRARRDPGEMLHLSVTDNGPGPVTADKVRQGGIGLSNIRARLEHHFAERGRLYLDRRVDGFCAELTLPFRM